MDNYDPLSHMDPHHPYLKHSSKKRFCMPSLLRRLCDWIHADRIPSSTFYGSENVTQICHDAAVCPSPPCQIFSNCVFRQALMTHQECFSCCLLFQNVIAFLCWNESESIVTFVKLQLANARLRKCFWGHFALAETEWRERKIDSVRYDIHWVLSNTYKH